MNTRVIIHLQRMVINKLGVACNLVLFRNGIHPFQHKTDKAISFAFDAIHYFTSINHNFTLRVNPKAGRFFNLVYTFCRGDQQFGRHTTHSRTGGAVRAAFNHHHIRSVSFRCTISAKASSTTANYGDINVNLFHYGSSIGLFSV
ncbi:Uncharacterised protein [Vibrio cholerae]|uniref:Uncharacterized protein n=1 Tax=Vibrio cholerae TaxID=666 RepID=A0A655WL56_VIBCL|nr:Uncharacterised protein [Vibrio cholerae]CSB68053.1 Uncharacterised protein [Vibrio cholerae]CSB76474.1 Uncharacterised protein [Vibrio cholerae]CSB92584.1 Uncharacterised protein [Vibrio cholerae]CSC03360.1 Uncharacterised protein [Vibrio cholerae]